MMTETISSEQALKYASQDEYTEIYNDYLKDVIFLGRNPTSFLMESAANDLKKTIMTKSFTYQDTYFAEAYNQISKVLPTNDKIENQYKKNTKVEINISKINDVDSQKDEWIPGTINKITRDDSNIIYKVKIDDSVDISKYKNNPDINIDNKTIAFNNKNFIHLPNWKDCVKDCYSMCHQYVKNEVESTAYMLRILSASVLGETEKYKVCFFVNDDKVFNANFTTIQGNWENDKQYFQIEICRISEDGKTIINYTKPINGRFILGAGPSASGKTYNAELMIQMMKMVDPSFPDFFMTIDGGTYREKSVIYQTIVDAVTSKNQYPGLNNLMSASIFDKARNVQSIFETDSIKKVINEYLLEQTSYRKKDKFIVSLYVPDTLTFCGVIKVDCIPKLQNYIDITGDNDWIGLMIYQHKTGGDGCPFQKEYKCVGCTESGKTREKTEGKKYSSGAWKMSYDHGLQTIKQAPNYRIVFHNGGKRGTPSIFEDLSTKKIPYDTNGDIKQFFTDKNIVYINGKLTENTNCGNYLLKGCQNNQVKKADQDVVRTDPDFVNTYKDKYIAIPKNVIDIINKQQFDTITDDDEIALFLMIQNLIQSGLLLPIKESEFNNDKLDENDKKYDYYKIDIDNDKLKYYDDINTLIENDSIRLYEPEEIDPEFINYYTNKYIGKNKTLDSDDDSIKTIMKKFIDSGVFLPIKESEFNNEKLDENDRKYDYYKIDMSRFDYFNDKDDFNTLMEKENDFIGLYELDKEQNTISKLWKSVSSSASAGISSVFNFTPFAKKNVPENLEELQTLNNAISNSDIQVDNNTNLIIVGNDGASEKIKEELGENTGIVVENTTNNNGVQITTVKATTPESSISLGKILTNLGIGAGDIAKSIASGAFGAVSGASQALKGVFINKKNVDNDGNLNFDSDSVSESNIIENQTPVPPYEEETKPATSVEPEPIINKLIDENDLIINTPPTKKKYIGIPKNVMMGDNNDDKRILNDLLKGKIIEKIEVDQNLLDEEKIPGYNEKNYDYYELKIDEYLRDRIRSINSIIHDDLNVLSQNNTLYIYEIEPDQATGVSNLSASTLFNNITGAISGASKNALSKLVGKITGESKKTKGKEEEIDESIIETNNKPPKCGNKKTTAKNTKSKGSNGTRKNNNITEPETQITTEKSSTFKNVADTLKNIIPLANKTKKNKKDVVTSTRSSSRNTKSVNYKI